jgi:hypothetical protein
MPKTNQQIANETVALLKHRIGMNQRLPKGLMDMRMTVWADVAAEEWVASLRAFFWTRPIGRHEVRYPTTWWDAFKDRWFPKWALARWPVAWTVDRFEAFHDYPTLALYDQSPELRIEHMAPINFMDRE